MCRKALLLFLFFISHQGFSKVNPTVLHLVVTHPDSKTQTTLYKSVETFLKKNQPKLEIIRPDLSQRTGLDSKIQDWHVYAKKVEELYFDGEFEEVLAHVTELNKVYKSVPTLNRIKHNLSQQYIRLQAFFALSYKLIKGQKAYKKYLKTILISHSGAQFSSATFPQEFIADVENVKKELRIELPSVRLDIRTTPSGATVYLDSIEIGTTPLHHTYRPSPEKYYDLFIEKEGCTPAQKTLTAQSSPHIILKLSTLTNQNPIDLLYSDAALSLDHIVPTASISKTNLIEDLSKFNQKKNAWVFLFTSKPAYYRFCFFKNNHNQWWCEKQPVALSGLRAALPKLYASYLNTLPLPKPRRLMSDKLSPVTSPPLPGKIPPPTSNTWPWVIGGAALAGIVSAALLITTSEDKEGPVPVTFEFPGLKN